MKKIVLSLLIASGLLNANAQLRTPAPSPTQSIKQDFGVSSVELIYSRPSIRGRKIFGDLVPWNAVWRTGANSATRIKFNDDVTFGGQPLKAGEYAIYTVPGQNEWEVIVNKGSANWGTEYKKEDDIFRVKAKPVELPYSIQSFTMGFSDVTATSCKLQMMWDNVYIDVPITTEIDKKVMAQIDNLINKDNRPYFQAAMYYLENGKDLNQALTWFDKAIAQNPTGYYIYHQKANTLAKLGRKDEARAVAQKSMDMAREQKNEDYVRLNEKLLAGLK
jgi:hypothetical protein